MNKDSSAPPFRSVSSRVQSALDRALFLLSIYVIPVLIGLVSLTALFAWQDRYQTSPLQALEFRAMREGGSEVTPSDALQALAGRPVLRYFDTNLSQQPVWFTLSTPAGPQPTYAVEFPSKHAVEIACWDGPTAQPLGRANGRDYQGSVAPLKSGYSLILETPGRPIVCRGKFVGPARLTAALWTPEDMRISEQGFLRDAGLLEGGMLALAVFTIFAAIINRSLTYVIFAAWLIVAFRSAAISAGWDAHWLGQTIPQDWVLPLRSLTRGAYAVLTVTLFTSLFQEELKKSAYRFSRNLLTWLSLGIVIAAVVLPRQLFLPTLWALGGCHLVWRLALDHIPIGSVRDHCRRFRLQAHA